MEMRYVDSPSKLNIKKMAEGLLPSAPNALLISLHDLFSTFYRSNHHAFNKILL